MCDLYDLNKITFFKLLNLKPTAPVNSAKAEMILYELTCQSTNLSEKNSNIKTGYENYCLTKGTVQLFPFKDFDFIGKNVVCQKCCLKFASKMSYMAHVGTDICVRTYNGPNLEYLKYKNRNCKQLRKKNKQKSETNLQGHDTKKNLLNPEMLNTLQTRNNCYSDVVHQRNKAKEKLRSNSSNKNDEPPTKKPRGRPRKNIEVEPKKRGRPKKFSEMTNNSNNNNNSPSQSCSSLDNNLESIETQLKEPKVVRIVSADDAYNNNINETSKPRLLSSKFKIITDKFWKLINTELKQDTDRHQNSTECTSQTESNEEKKKADLLVKGKTFFLNVERLENDLKFLSEHYHSKNDYAMKDELEAMLSKLNEKRNEIKQCILKEFDVNNGSTTTDKGKENFLFKMKMEKDETDFDIKNCIEIWIKHLDHKVIVSPVMSTMSKRDIEYTDADNLAEESTSNDNIQDNFKTFIDDIAPKCPNSAIDNLNYTSKPMLDCKQCGITFVSIAEWKMHTSEHVEKSFEQHLLCKICGLKFKKYKNFLNHLHSHGVAEKKNMNSKKNSPNLKCKRCGRKFYFLGSYFAHIKTHNK